MRNSFSSSDQITIKLKTKTNSSVLYQYSRKQLTKSITDQRPEGTIESSMGENGRRQTKFWYGMSASNNKLAKKPSSSNVIPQVMTSHHPVSPNSKRLQQLQLFRFDDKIQQIQSQQIQQLISQQIKATKDKQLQRISQLLNKSPIHPNNTNAFRLFKRSVHRGVKGTGHDPSTRYGNKTAQGSEMGNNKIGCFIGRTQPNKNATELIEKRKESRSIVVNESKKTEGDLQNSRLQRPIKPNASLPVWQRNIFHQKIITRQTQKHSMNKTYFSSTNQNPAFFSSSPKRNNQSPQKLSQIQQSLTFLKNKSFSIKKNYQFFINKMNSSNPQVQEQLIDELKKSKMNQRLLLDNNCKSFSGYCKMKSYMYNKQGAQQKLRAEMMRQGNQSGNELYRNVANVTSYKFSHLKPLKLRLSKKNKNQLLLFDDDQQREPKIRRLQLNENSQDELNQQEEGSQYNGISPKFRELYKDKHDQKEIEKYIAERQKISREASSPYHQLSAWN